MKNRYWMTSFLLGVSLLMGGCAGQTQEEEKQEPVIEEKSQEEAEDSEAEKEYQRKLDMIQPAAYNNVDGLQLEPGSYISVIGQAEGGIYWDEVKRGVEQAVKDLNQTLGYEGKDKVKVTYSGPSEAADVDEQVNILDEELARYPVALGISIADTNACEVQFDLAAESGIPVVAYDSGSDYQGLMATVSTNHDAAAREAAARLAESMDHAGEVMMFVHDAESKAGRIREASFRSEIETNHPGISIVEVYYMDDPVQLQQRIADEMNAGTYRKADEDGTPIEGLGTAAGGEAVTADQITEEDIYAYLRTKYPEVKGFYGTSGAATEMAAEYAEGYEDDLEEMSVVGFDIGAETLDELEDGSIDGVIIQNPFGMGYGTVVACARAALNPDLATPKSML